MHGGRAWEWAFVRAVSGASLRRVCGRPRRVIVRFVIRFVVARTMVFVVEEEVWLSAMGVGWKSAQANAVQNCSHVAGRSSVAVAVAMGLLVAAMGLLVAATGRSCGSSASGIGAARARRVVCPVSCHRPLQRIDVVFSRTNLLARGCRRHREAPA